MLLRLDIKNYALIDHLEVDFSEGLNIITGETGAGKSIPLGALGLILGNRADTKSLRDPSKKCVVEATYDISKYQLTPFFEENDIDYEDETIIRRIITPSGKSRGFVNDIPTTAKVLKQLSGYLIDLHQQFDLLDIHKVSFQTNTLDAISHNMAVMEEYRTLYQSYTKTQKQLTRLQEQESQNTKEDEFLRFQLDEIENIDLQEGEYSEMEAQLEKLNNAETIKTQLTEIVHLLTDSDSNIADMLQSSSTRIGNYAHIDNDLRQIDTRLSTLIEEARDLSQDTSRYADNIEYDEAQINEITERVDAINRLMRKHDLRTDHDLFELRDALHLKLSSFGSVSEDILKTKKLLAEQEVQLTTLAERITSNRKAHIPDFENRIREMLAPLSMENAHLKVDLVPFDTFRPAGKEEVSFLFASNKGSTFKPLKDIASGGEISRLTLCIKALIADAVTLPTLIFDEIDTGVSGEVASRMGDIFTRLAAQHQVISITHSPQIAAKAETHFFVYKSDDEESTSSDIKRLSFDERITEIAKMLSGNPPSTAAIANARELLK